MLRIWLKRFTWLVLTGVVAVFATEGFTRALMPQNRDTILDILISDETVGYIYDANTQASERGRDYNVSYDTNSLGLRDREYSTEKSDAYRVLLIGNSFCVSHGLEIQDSMSRALERELEQQFAINGSKRSVQVINTSNAGYTPYNYWKSYERWAPIFQPDAVVVGFVAAREHLCDHEDAQFIVRDGLLLARYRAGEEPTITPRSPIRVVRKNFARNSDFYVLLRNFFYYNDRVGKFLGEDGGLGGAARLTDPYRLDPPARVSKGRQRGFDFLSRLQEETFRDDVSLIVMGIPQKSDILHSAWETTLLRAKELNVTVSQHAPMESLTEYCQNSNISIIDLEPALTSVGAAGFFVHDNHWNNIGVTAAAKLVAKNWERLNTPSFSKELEPDK